MDFESEILEFLKYREGTSTIEEIGSAFNLDPFREVSQICGALKDAGKVSFDGWKVSLLRYRKSKKSEIPPPQSGTYKKVRDNMLDILSRQDEVYRRAKKYKKMRTQGRTFCIIGGLCFAIAFGYLFPYGGILFSFFLLHGIVFLILGNVYLIIGYTHK